MIDFGQCEAEAALMDRVAVAEDHNCGVRDGVVMCWGADASGQSTPP